MALVDLWNKDRAQITSKRIDQLISFAGEGKLLDGNLTSREFRELLSVVPSDLLGKWIEVCLSTRFTDFGLVLQDIVNEVGRRLNFNVTFGVYRSSSTESFDGLWTTLDGIALLVESKSSTSYSINLARIANYRKQVAERLAAEPESISILFVVGDNETADLESQVRGSKYAWNVRLIGVHALFRLLKIKEALDDIQVERQIRGLLVPQEFTRLDRIIDLVFATAEDVKSDEPELIEDTQSESERTIAPVNFAGEIIPTLERHFQTSLVRKSRVLWASPTNGLLVSCQVSKRHNRPDMHYWFGLKRSTKERLESHPKSECVFGLGDPKKVVMMPFNIIGPLLGNLFTSPHDDKILHWHIRFKEENGKVYFLSDRDQHRLDVTSYLLH